MDWISVDKELPRDNEIVLCCDIYNTFISLGAFIENENCFDLMNIDGIEIDSQVTHWMTLPEFPS